MNKKLYFWDFVLLWCGASISITEILTGKLIASVGFEKGLLAIVLGNLVGTIILVLVGIIGTRERISGIDSTRYSFGIYGSCVFSILNIFQLVGWLTIMIKYTAGYINEISTMLWSLNNIFLWTVITGVMIIIWIICGITNYKNVNNVTVVVLFILTFILAYVMFKYNKMPLSAGQSKIQFGRAFELVVIMPLSWVSKISDYTKFSVNTKQGMWGSFIGYISGSSLMLIIGLGVSCIFGNMDIKGALFSRNAAFVTFGVIILSTITTAFMYAYSAGVTLVNMIYGFNRKTINEKTIAVIITIIGTVISLMFNVNNYENFLYSIGIVFAPSFAILLTDYFIISAHTKKERNMVSKAVAFIVCIFGMFVYYIFIRTNFIFGATVPSMIIVSITYIVAVKLAKLSPRH
ncbi:cytosine permease [Clostridium sp. Mt-5]|uniref:Cytosine permease n=1 Tax=Clostridium moutaii TaxID=3240932 RepID=A0ABV4BLL8_9CLOT